MNYTITINQIRSAQFTVNAQNAIHAREMALDLAYAHDFGESDCAYTGHDDQGEFDEDNIDA